ncbi:hypothetical protein [Cellulomonas soli]|uniref:Uncharacterized protein n=1 Tax=Cellulomonas soli TaxID=931535 RepID=A0A512PHK1_9CELL|nr:hypothetical protein [Cellulomonas soli]NYI59159.1 hypothetical protein [Cellulomonas soli]GEP70663.1 hypothetical protein CSO01_33780 [Cellulomonas soli]
MSDLRELAAFLRATEHSIATADRSDDWASSANRASLRALHAEARDAWVARQKGLRAHFAHGDVIGHAGPAHSMLRAAQALNDAVVAAANRHLLRPFSKVDDRARDRLGMWLVPVGAGSIVIDLVCQPSNAHDPELRDDEHVQLTLAGTDAVETISMRAVDEVVASLREAQHGEGGTGGLADRLTSIGVPATRQLDRFAARCIDLGSTVTIDDRTGTRAPVELTPADSAYLRKIVRSLELDVEVVAYEGEWVTASHVRTTFDLLTAAHARITGTVPRSLLGASSASFGQWVRIEVDESVRDGDDDATVRRTLRSIEQIDPPTDITEDEPDVTG